MASHAQLSHVKSIAKANYEIRKDEAEARARPPGGQNINKRLLQKSVKRVNDAWRNYFDAALTLPVNVGLNQAQILLGIDADIEVTEETLKKGLDDVEASLNDALAPVTRERLAREVLLLAEMRRGN